MAAKLLGPAALGGEPRGISGKPTDCACEERAGDGPEETSPKDCFSSCEQRAKVFPTKSETWIPDSSGEILLHG